MSHSDTNVMSHTEDGAGVNVNEQADHKQVPVESRENEDEREKGFIERGTSECLAGLHQEDFNENAEDQWDEDVGGGEEDEDEADQDEDLLAADPDELASHARTALKLKEYEYSELHPYIRSVLLRVFGFRLIGENEPSVERVAAEQKVLREIACRVSLKDVLDGEIAKEGRMLVMHEYILRGFPPEERRASLAGMYESRIHYRLHRDAPELSPEALRTRLKEANKTFRDSAAATINTHSAMTKQMAELSAEIAMPRLRN